MHLSLPVLPNICELEDQVVWKSCNCSTITSVQVIASNVSLGSLQLIYSPELVTVVV